MKNAYKDLFKKLDKAFRINPLCEADGYKVGHKDMLAKGTMREYWTWIPRSFKFMPEGIDEIMSGGQQLVVRYLHSHFKELFFDKPVSEVEKFGRDMCSYLMMDYNADHFIDLHKLGYLPIEICALPEGEFTNNNVPHMVGINTVDNYAWFGLFLETLVSKLAWQLPVVATIGYAFKKNSVDWVNKTDSANMWVTYYMNHDFHSRGGNPFTSIAAGLGHAFSNRGSDTLNVIEAARYYYDEPEDVSCINSVNASEHSVTCTGIFYYLKRLKAGLLDERIKEYYSFDYPCEGSVDEPDFLAIAEWLNLADWLIKFSKGILSVVSDTFNLWKLVTFILPRLKKQILARDGKLVIRPDSGDPVDIVCGHKEFTVEEGKYYTLNNRYMADTLIENKDIPACKGLIELLWDIFGGDKSVEGYKRLDSHIGAIYGDSINLKRQVQIYERLANKDFAATNIILGVGSFSYVYMTRDQAGWAAKGAWFEILEDGVREAYNIFKDPITDDGAKKSLKGFQFVNEKFEVTGEVSEEMAFSEANMLKRIYRDGIFYNQTTLTGIREKLANKLEHSL